MICEHVHGKLVGGHRDGHVGYLPDELGGEAAVQLAPAALVVHEAQRLPEGPVLGAGFSHPCSCNLWTNEMRQVNRMMVKC